MDSIFSCRYVEGLFGDHSPSVPIFGSRSAIAALLDVLNDGLAAVNKLPPEGEAQSAYSLELGVQLLQDDDVVGKKVHDLKALSDYEKQILDLEPGLLEPLRWPQFVGEPPFKELNLDSTLASFRYLARQQELLNGTKPILQLGIVTMKVDKDDHDFLVQVFPAEAGRVTNTVWLYRFCIMGGDQAEEDGEFEYVEHWRPFDHPFSDDRDWWDNFLEQTTDAGSPLTLAVPAAKPVLSLNTTFATARTFPQSPTSTLAAFPSPIPSPTLALDPCLTTYPSPPQPSPFSKRTRTRSIATDTAAATPTDDGAPTPKRRRRYNKYHMFDPTGLTDEQIFASGADNIQGATIMLLAERYNNTQIMERINAQHTNNHNHHGNDGDPAPPPPIKNANVITKRLTHAVVAEAERAGRTVEQIRCALAAAKERNGVPHKMKLVKAGGPQKLGTFAQLPEY